MLTCLPIEQSESAVIGKLMPCMVCCLLLLTLASKASHKIETGHCNDRFGNQAVRADHDLCDIYVHFLYKFTCLYPETASPGAAIIYYSCCR